MDGFASLAMTTAPILSDRRPLQPQTQSSTKTVERVSIDRRVIARLHILWSYDTNPRAILRDAVFVSRTCGVEEIDWIHRFSSPIFPSPSRNVANENSSQ
jgi:hypothetical protein